MIPKLSKKRLAQLDGKKLYSTITASRKAPRRRNPARKAKEFARCYHSEERVLFVKGLTCLGCGYSGAKMENAHTEGDGAGRKAHYTKIVPLCGDWVDFNYGCHHELHQYGRASFERDHRLDLDAEAAKVERAWQDHLTGESAT